MNKAVEAELLNIPPHINPEIFQHFQRLEQERKSETNRTIPVIEAVQVKKSFGSNLVIPDLNFRVDDIEGKSEIISVIGPSGCGKSTILKLIAGLIEPTSGEIRVFGTPVTAPGMDRGMIFQKYSSFPFLTVLENVAWPLILVKKYKRADAMDLARQWVEKMYLSAAMDKYPYQLSGGMQQRVAIARTLCMDARIILMDEPFGALDRKIRWEMQDLIAEISFLKPATEFTVLIVTHDIPEAIYLGDRIWTIYNGSILRSDYAERPVEPARVAQGRKQFQEMVTYFNEIIDKLELKDEDKL